MEYKEEIKMEGGERWGKREKGGKKECGGEGKGKETRGEAGQGGKQGERGSVHCAGMLE